MKKLVLTLTLCSMFVSAKAVNLVINAKSDVKSIVIFHYDYAKNKIEENSSLKQGGVLTFHKPELKGLFTFYLNNRASIYYFEDDKQVEMEIEGDNLVIKNRSELNEKLHQWHLLSKEARAISLEYYLSNNELLHETEKCIAIFENLRVEKDKFLNNSKGLNEKSLELLTIIVGADFDRCVMGYTSIPTISKPITFPDTLIDEVVKKDKFSNPKVIEYYPEIYAYTSAYANFARKYSKLQRSKNIDYFESDRVKALNLLCSAKGYKNYAQYEQLVKDFGHLFVTDSERIFLKSIENQLSIYKQGADGYHFEFPDVHGKIVKLSDFKGKLVYIDLWATWCGPCKKEIPYLQALEEKMRGKDVVFISISIDEKEQTWQNFLTSRNMHGVQLIDIKSEMMKKYGFNGVPSFLLYDKNGKVIVTDAPRPSSPQAEKLIENWLTK